MGRGKILVRKSGLQTSVQDVGRMGYMQCGLPHSGYMDHRSAVIANRLVGNPNDTALLETVMQGLSLEFFDSCLIAIAGADLGAELNDDGIENHSVYQVERGDVLTFKKRKSGIRAYLAFSGGIDTSLIMGSRSTHSLFDLGNKQISDGSQIFFRKTRNLSVIEGKLELPTYSSHFSARILPGPEYSLFSSELVDQLSSFSFTISPDSNRMGYRLQGNLEDGSFPEGIVSSGTVPGTIQITSSGQPIILMKDGPTTGGYARIGNVISPDLDFVAQLGPGDTIRFKWVSFEEADLLLQNYLRYLDQALA